MTSLKLSSLAALLVLATGLSGAIADDDIPPAATLPPQRPHHVYLVGDLRVIQPWIDTQDTADGATSAYLTIENRGTLPDRLTRASVSGAAAVKLAGSSEDTPADSITVPPRGTLLLQPGAAHLVVEGLQGLTRGAPRVEGTLSFEKAGPLHLSFATDHALAEKDDQDSPDDEKAVDLAQ